MKRLPLLPTLLVAVAITAMVTLGLWQLRRAVWKEGLLARYEAARALPPVMLTGRGDETLLFRRAAATCRPPIAWTIAPGRDRAGRTGWRHIAACADDLGVDTGLSARFADRVAWGGGAIVGTLAPRPEGRSLIEALLHRGPPDGVLIVADRPAAGLAASAPPDLAAIPNNHRAYAVQWFLFAAVAAIIYPLALSRRRRR